MEGYEPNKMIAFADDYEGPESPLSNKELKEFLKALLDVGGTKFSVNSYHSGLSPAQIERIISYLMYTQNHNSVTLTIDKELDGYHLGLSLDKLSEPK